MLLTLCIIILILYFIQWMKWHQTVPPKLEGYQYIPDCTIIIPFRNEAHHLPLLLQKLQLHLPDRWRIILVNDHSEDDSLIKIKPHLNLQTQVLQSKGEGKKIALRTGIEMAHTPWIITMDADVQLSNDWTSSLYCADWSSDMIIFSLHMPGSHDFIYKTQAIEFSIFQYLTAKSCYKGQPQLCNGALLGFKRKSFIEVGGYERHEEIASGDDQFLMAYFREKNKRITFHDTQDKVQIEGQNQWRSLIQQRMRWAQKSKDMPLRDMKKLGWITLSANLAAIALPFLTSGILAVGLLMMKWVPEYFAIRPDLRKQFPIITIVFLITYPIWVLIIGVGIVIFPIEWKGRPLNQS